MFQLRLALMVAVILLAGGVVLVAGTTALTEQVLEPFDSIASHASSAVAGQIVRHGADAVDAAARAAVDPAARDALKKAAMAPEAEAALLARAGGAGAPAFALLVKPDGTVAARAGAADVKLDANIAGLPVFAEAKTGVARDAALSVDGTPYHLAAAPAYEGADLVGVVVLGWPYDAAFADELSRVAQVSAILVSADKRLGSALPELTVEDLKATQSFGTPDTGDIPGGVLPVLVPETGRYLAIALPVFPGDDAMRVVVVTDRNAAIKALATSQALVIIGTLGLALIMAILTFSVLRAVRKPIDIIMDHLAQFQQGGNIGILPEANLSGPFLRLGKQVNMILQMMPSAARPGTPLGTLTGSLPAVGASFPPGNGADFASPEMGSGPRPASPPSTLGEFKLPAHTPNPAPNVPMPNRAPPSTGVGNAAVAQGGASGGGLAGLFDDGPDPLAAFRVPGASAPPAPQPAYTPPVAAPEPQPELADDGGAPAPNVQPEATVMFQVPQELIKQSAEAAQAQAHSFSTPQANKPVDDARTVVAQVPQELLSQVAPKADNADEAHYREVYDKFVETRIQCGEDTSDLTYDRFVQKLLKNRQQIVEKHKAKSVRFQVYVKEGKAALRALPVREP